MYIDGFVAAVPAANKDAYIEMSKGYNAYCKKLGALKTVDCWGDDVPDGKLTSFPLAVKLEEGEVVCFPGSNGRTRRRVMLRPSR